MCRLFPDLGTFRIEISPSNITMLPSVWILFIFTWLSDLPKHLRGVFEKSAVLAGRGQAAPTWLQSTALICESKALAWQSICRACRALSFELPLYRTKPWKWALYSHFFWCCWAIHHHAISALKSSFFSSISSSSSFSTDPQTSPTHFGCWHDGARRGLLLLLLELLASRRSAISCAFLKRRAAVSHPLSQKQLSWWIFAQIITLSSS